MQAEHIIGLIILGFIIYRFYRWLTNYHRDSKESTPQEKVESSPKENSQEVTNQDLFNDFCRDMKETGTILNEYFNLLAREEGSRLICFEEDLPYSKERIKKALLIQTACRPVDSEDKEPDERTSAYQNAFIALASFIPKKDADGYKNFISYQDKARQELEGEFIGMEDPVEFAKGVVGNLSKLDFKKWGEEIVERRKKLRTEWDLELMKYVSWFAIVYRS